MFEDTFFEAIEEGRRRYEARENQKRQNRPARNLLFEDSLGLFLTYLLFLLRQKKNAHASHHGCYVYRDVERDELLSKIIVVVAVEQTNLFEQKIHRLLEE